MQIGNGTFLNGDCLELMKDIPDASVDMILCDLPYGIPGQTVCEWDTLIPFEQLWENYWRVLKPNKAIVLTSIQPFTTTLISSQQKYFKYNWVWIKNRGPGFAQAKNMPIKTHEDICVFSKGVINHESVTNNRMPYNPQGLIYSPKTHSNRDSKYGDASFTKRPSHKDTYVQEYTNYPNSILEFDVERDFHPTQKPVKLFEYLINTYSNENETVLDNTAGSGTTAIAAENTKRNWICIERDGEYYSKATTRVINHVNNKKHSDGGLFDF